LAPGRGRSSLCRGARSGVNTLTSMRARLLKFLHESKHQQRMRYRKLGGRVFSAEGSSSSSSSLERDIVAWTIPGEFEGELAFMCVSCGYASCRSDNVKRHLLVHRRRIRFQCPKCPRSYLYQSDLAQHKKVHSRNPGYVCAKCQATFKNPSQKKTHVAKKCVFRTSHFQTREPVMPSSTPTPTPLTQTLMPTDCFVGNDEGTSCVGPPSEWDSAWDMFWST
jgi:hypothetical protein